MFYGQFNKAIEGSGEESTVEVEFDPDMYHNIKKERANCSTISFRVTYTLPGYGLYFVWFIITLAVDCFHTSCGKRKWRLFSEIRPA
jgi:hypothetical protein